MRGKFYLFEGVDFAGKTHLAELLVRKLDGKYFHSPPESMKAAKKRMNEATPEERYNFYLAGNFLSMSSISDILVTHDAIVEKYFPATIVTHSVILERELKMPSNILLPDHIIYVSASPAELARRREAREKKGEGTHKYDNIDLLVKFDRAYQTFFEGMNNVINIDTTGRKPEQSFQELREQLEL